LRQQQRDVIHPLRPNGQCLVHPNSLSACWQRVQIYANREYTGHNYNEMMSVPSF
jgi:hypothetical protein